MQQYHNIQQTRGWNQLPRQNKLPTHEHYFQQNVQNQHMPLTQNPNAENIARQQIHLQQSAPHMDNRAMPQEPRKINYGPNMPERVYKQYRDGIPRLACMVDMKRNTGSLSPEDYSPDVSQNLNDAFCQSKSDDKAHHLNETYIHPDATVVTNNATCNDDSLLLEFLLDSPTPSENCVKSRDSAVNTESTPSAPFRKKKAQKLEQLVLSAINSQNEVVNKVNFCTFTSILIYYTICAHCFIVINCFLFRNFSQNFSDLGRPERHGSSILRR